MTDTATQDPTSQEALRDLRDWAMDEEVRLKAALALRPVLYSEGLVEPAEFEKRGIDAIPVFGKPAEMVAWPEQVTEPTKPESDEPNDKEPPEGWLGHIGTYLENGDYTEYATESARRQTRAHAQEMAVRALGLMSLHDLTLEEYRTAVKDWADWFEADLRGE